MATACLVINSGSSSLKYQLIDVSTSTALATGLIERIGSSDSSARHTAGAGPSQDPRVVTRSIPDHAAAFEVMQEQFSAAGQPLGESSVSAIGHRVVHGGPIYGAPVLIDDDVLSMIKTLARLAPLHNPANALGIEQARRAFPGVPEVAVFDTAFFRDLPAAAATYAIDAKVAEDHQIRRYGFHGTSHQYVSTLAATTLGRDVEATRTIVLHLGNGASISAVRNGRAVETSMGLTPLEGLVMGTRSGDLDPGAVLYLLRSAGLDADGVDTLLNKRSGLLGLAGVSDVRDVLKRRTMGNKDAALAMDVFCHRARKYIGAYLAVLGGADIIAFTAGVGENSPAVRAQIVEGLEGLGIELDPVQNETAAEQPRVISPAAAPVTVMVVPTNEELAIARQTMQLVGS